MTDFTGRGSRSRHADGRRIHGGLIGRMILIAILAPLVLTACLTTTARRPVPPPWVPPTGDAVELEPPVGVVVPVYWMPDNPPEIDGEFGEWDGLETADPYVSVYGGGHEPDDASGRFVVATDGDVLYLFAEIVDDQPNENPLTPAMAWRNDSVEFFFGVITGRHRTFQEGDNQIRVVPVNRDDPFEYSLAINDVDMTRQSLGAAAFTEQGYTVEAAVDLALLRIESLREGQDVRVEFQINDGDETERDRLVHWMSENDDPWFDPSVWGDGRIVSPQEASRDSE